MRICNASDISIIGKTSLYCDNDTTHLAMANSTAVDLTFRDEDETIMVAINGYKIFDRTLQIVSSEKAVQKGEAYVLYSNFTTQKNGISQSGSIEFKKARILERNGLNNNPLLIAVEGAISGAINIFLARKSNQYKFAGNFNTYMALVGRTRSSMIILKSI